MDGNLKGTARPVGRKTARECRLELDTWDREPDRLSTCDGCGKMYQRGEQFITCIESCCGGGCYRALCLDCIRDAAELGGLFAAKDAEIERLRKPNAMTPEEFAWAMVLRKKRTQRVGQGRRHELCDILLCRLLRQLGYGDGVNVYESMEKWYE